MTAASIARQGEHGGQEGADVAPAPDLNDTEGPPPEPLSEVVVPWVISATFHLGLGLLFAFIFFAAKSKIEQAQQSIIVPQSFEDPSYSEHPGGNPNPGAADPMQLAAQDRLKALLRSEGWTDN